MNKIIAALIASAFTMGAYAQDAKPAAAAAAPMAKAVAAAPAAAAAPMAKAADAPMEIGRAHV